MTGVFISSLVASKIIIIIYEMRIVGSVVNVKRFYQINQDPILTGGSSAHGFNSITITVIGVWTSRSKTQKTKTSRICLENDKISNYKTI